MQTVTNQDTLIPNLEDIDKLEMFSVKWVLVLEKEVCTIQ